MMKGQYVCYLLKMFQKYIYIYTHTYRRPFCIVWAQLPLGKASGERGLAHRTHAHGQALPWGIRPALYLGRFETCFLLKLPHPDLRQQMFIAYL